MAAALLIFALCVGFCIYTMAVYPLLLWVESRARGRRIQKAPMTPLVTVILPVHNGERWIAAKLDSIAELKYPAERIEVLVVDDGSTDESLRVVEGYRGRARTELLALPRGGKAVALNAAIARAKGEILFFTDVRQALAPDSLANLVACFADPTVGVASGELIIRDSDGIEETSVGMYWKYEKWIRKQLSRIDSVPGATGCIYAMRRSLARPMPEDTLVDDMFLPLGAFFAGYRVVLDDSARAFDYPTQLASEFRRKVRTLAGVYQVIRQYPELLGPRNRMWIHFVSHKLARLLMPWALLAAAISTAFLLEPWRTPAFLAQLLGYGLAAADYVMPETSRVRRITSPARTFLVLMVASFCAVCIFFVPPRVLWGHTRVSQSAAAR